MGQNPPDDIINRQLFIARKGRPHNPAIAHLSETHSLPATADYLLETAVKGKKDPDTAKMLSAIRAYRDADPASATFGSYKWFVEDPAIHDTNASFFICLPLAALWLVCRDSLTNAEAVELSAVFHDVLPWFRRMADSPSFFYPNKCISDAAMLLAAGHILGNEAVKASGREFCSRYFDYYVRRGTGWGEDHSPCYTAVIVEMTLLIMALEKSGALFDKARRMTDAILGWVAFHDGVDAVPSIRGYNSDCAISVPYQAAALINAVPSTLLGILKEASGYNFRPEPRQTPRQQRWRTFDGHFSTSYIGSQARLGTLSYYPLMPNSYMHDSWGLGWQSKPCSFIVGEEEYGVLEWMSEDDKGVIRQHEAKDGIYDWDSRHLFKRVCFHPDVIMVGHQEEKAAIILREIHNLHSPTIRLADRWRLARAGGRIIINGREWDGKPMEVPPGWGVVQCSKTAVALRPLKCRLPDKASDDPNPQKRSAGNIVDLPLRIERSERGTRLSLFLVNAHDGVLTQRLFFSGWCVALLDSPDDVAGLAGAETFHDDGELPRTYGELIRTVEFTTREVRLRLVRDMLNGAVRRFINGSEFSFKPNIF